MKTCHECGALVEDDELVCPECGTTVMKRNEGFSLKEQEPVKKRTNPMGTPVSTGSGLTDLLRGEDDGYVDDEGFGGGSIPMSMTRTNVSGDYSNKRKSNIGGVILKFVIVVALLYGVYYLVTNVLTKTNGATESQQALEFYVDAINDKDRDKLLLIIPPYVTTNLDRADKILDQMKNAHIDKYEILETTNYDSNEIMSMQDTIKLETGKTANIKEACRVKVRFDGNTLNASGVSIGVHSEVEMEFIKVRSRWYLYVGTYDNSDFE